MGAGHTTEEIDEMMNTNLRGAFLTIREVLPDMKKAHGGDILNITSVAGCISPQGQCFYGATKAAVNHMTKGLAVEVAKYDIRVNCLAPGPINTPLWDTISNSPSEAESFKTMLAEKTPLGRIAEPMDIAHWALKIVDPNNTWMTGSVINLDGGRGLVG